MSKTFRAWHPDQTLLLPPSVRGRGPRALRVLNVSEHSVTLATKRSDRTTGHLSVILIDVVTRDAAQIGGHPWPSWP
jgi:hypothetical protein